MLLEWEDKYSVGITLMDHQHKKLVEMINQLHDALGSGKGSETVGKILKNLIQYTRSHFVTEEKIMEDHSYPDLPPHKERHQKLVKKVLEFQEELKAGNTMLSVPVMNFLKDWLVSHIMNEDKKYSPFFHDRGIN